MEKWKAITFLAVPGCIGAGVYLFSNHHAHEEHDIPVRPPTQPRDPTKQRLSGLYQYLRSVF